MMIQNAQQIENTPILWRHLSPEQQTLTKAGLVVNVQDNPIVNSYLDLLVQAYNQQSGG